jgi:hypothetical protein
VLRGSDDLEGAPEDRVGRRLLLRGTEEVTAEFGEVRGRAVARDHEFVLPGGGYRRPKRIG